MSAGDAPTDLRALMRPAAVLEAGPFSHRMALAVRASPEGLSRLRLTPELLALARPDLGDVRIVDASSRQWPYVVKEAAARLLLDVRLAASRAEQGTSRYAVGLPAGPTQVDELLIRVDPAYLDRPYRLVGKRIDGEERTLRTGRITRRVGEPAEAALAVPSARVSELALVIEDGDEAPLALTEARAAFTVPDLLLVAPSGEYTLLVGDPGRGPPRYELSRFREAILAANAGAVELGPLGSNPAHRGLELASKGALEGYVMWGALVLAAVVLAALALRLARREAAAPAGGKAEGEEGPDAGPGA